MRKLNIPTQLSIVFSVALIVLVFGAGSFYKVNAQQEAGETGLLDPGFAFGPKLVKDSQGNLHALWVHIFDKDTNDVAIMHSQFSNGQWPVPIDVLVPPPNTVVIELDAVIDEADFIHLIIVTLGRLYYSKAHADSSGTATGWLKPIPISPAFAGPSSIILDPDGTTIHVIFPEIQVRPGYVYHTSSSDGGLSWSEPRRISDLVNPLAVAVNTHAAQSGNGRLHVVWSETIDDFPPSGVFYAYSDDGGKTWEGQQMVDGPGYNWISVGLEADNQHVHLIWTGTGEVAGKYHMMSTDGGESWSERRQIFRDWAGYLGRATFVLDDAGTLHLGLAMGGTLDGVQSFRGQLFHSTWQDVGWSEPVAVAPGLWEDPLLEQGTPGMAIINGNELHFVWSGMYWPDRKISSVWHSREILDIPRVEPIPVTETESPSFIATQTTFTKTPVPVPTDSDPERTEFSVGPNTDYVPQNPVGAIIVGAASTMFLITIVVIVRATSKNSLR